MNALTMVLLKSHTFLHQCAHKVNVYQINDTAFQMSPIHYISDEGALFVLLVLTKLYRHSPKCTIDRLDESQRKIASKKTEVVSHHNRQEHNTQP